MPESKEIAEYYAKVRKIPQVNLFGIRMSKEETVSRKDYEKTIQEPLLKLLVKGGFFRFDSGGTGRFSKNKIKGPLVDASIRYAVACYGVPLRISEDPKLKEEGVEEVRKELRANHSAVDNELALIPRAGGVLKRFGPLNNPFYGWTNAASFHPTNGILMVARLDGPSPSSVKNMIDQAVAAEKNGLWGRAYFDARGITNGSYRIGDDWMRAGAEITMKAGLETYLDLKPETFPKGFPLSRIAYYAGWYDGSVSGPFQKKSVEFMPGAFAYHLHSFSAETIRSDSRRWAGPLIAKGATVTMGCVYEPYLQATPDIKAFTLSFIGRGFSFGEAAYSSLSSLSWQTTLIGDPLYRPFGVSPRSRHDILLKNKDPRIEWSYQKIVNLSLVHGGKLSDSIQFLQNLKETLTSSVLSEKLGDLLVKSKDKHSALQAYRESLDLTSSLQQKKRLYLRIGDLILESTNKSYALIWYRTFMEEYPDYEGIGPICKILIPIAEKTGKAADSAYYENKLRIWLKR